MICRVLLSRAAGWITGQIAARLLQLIIQVDPGYYERRYRKAVREWRVCGYLDSDGTAAHPDTSHGWAGLIADIAAQHADRAEHLRDLDAHPHDRFPRAALRRHAQIRDRS